MRLLPTLVIALALLVPAGIPATAQSPAESDFPAGFAAWEDGDFATAAAIWRPLAEAGSAPAQYALGLLYERGDGVARDDAKAADWFRKAAMQGSAAAQHSLGAFYAAGRGVPRDAVQAGRWYLAAAEQGHAPAQFSMGLVRELGLGVAQDDARALMWYALAVRSGMAEAETLQAELAARASVADTAEARRLEQAWLMRQQPR